MVGGLRCRCLARVCSGGRGQVRPVAGGEGAEYRAVDRFDVRQWKSFRLIDSVRLFGFQVFDLYRFIVCYPVIVVFGWQVAADLYVLPSK